MIIIKVCNLVFSDRLVQSNALLSISCWKQAEILSFTTHQNVRHELSSVIQMGIPMHCHALCGQNSSLRSIATGAWHPDRACSFLKQTVTCSLRVPLARLLQLLLSTVEWKEQMRGRLQGSCQQLLIELYTNLWSPSPSQISTKGSWSHTITMSLGRSVSRLLRFAPILLKDSAFSPEELRRLIKE